MRNDEAGSSLIEVMVSVIVFSIGVLGLTSAGLVAAKHMKMSQAYMTVQTVAAYQLERVTAQGYDGVTSGSATVRGTPVAWDVTGADPKKVVLVIQAKTWRGDVVPDTFVTYLADWTP